MTDTTAPIAQKSGPRVSGALHRLLAFSGLIALVVVFSLASPNFMQTQNVLAILQATSVNGVLAVAATLVIITGGIDLSVGTLMTFCAVIAGVILTYWGLPLPLGVLGAILAGTAVGLVSGTIIAKLKVPPFIATLGMMVSARGVAKWWTNGEAVSNPTESFVSIGTGMMPVIILLVIGIFFHLLLTYTLYGRHTYAIGSNAQAARMSGINVERHLVKVYAVAGVLSSLAGIVVSARGLTAQAGMGVAYELDAIAMAVIGGISLAGGRGTVLGTIIGAVIFGVIISGFTFLRLDAYYQEMIKAFIIVAAGVAAVYRRKKRLKKS